MRKKKEPITICKQCGAQIVADVHTGSHWWALNMECGAFCPATDDLDSNAPHIPQDEEAKASDEVQILRKAA